MMNSTIKAKVILRLNILWLPVPPLAIPSPFELASPWHYTVMGMENLWNVEITTASDAYRIQFDLDGGGTDGAAWEQRYRQSALSWNQRNWCPIAKHLAWGDYRRFQKPEWSQVHEGDSGLRPQGRASWYSSGSVEKEPLRREPIETHSVSGHSAGNCIATSKLN